METYTKEIENKPNPVMCGPVYAGFYFNSHKLRLTTSCDNAGKYFELKDLNKEQLLLAAKFAGMVSELAGLDNFEKAILKNVAELAEIKETI